MDLRTLSTELLQSLNMNMTAARLLEIEDQVATAAAESAQAEANALRAELDALKVDRAAIVDALNLGQGDDAAIAVTALVTQRDNLQKERDDIDRVYDAFRSGIVEQLGIPDEANVFKAINGLLVIAADRDELVRENATLKAKIAELEGKPPAVPAEPEQPPVSVPPKPTFPRMILEGTADNHFGLFISDGMSAGNDSQMRARNAYLKGVIDFAASSKVINCIYLFGNLLEMRHWASGDGFSPYAYAHQYNMEVVTDTMNTIPLDKIAEYVDLAEHMLTAGYAIDDAQRWIPSTATTADRQIEMAKLSFIRAHVGAIRSISKKPIIASYGAKTNTSQHDSLNLVKAVQCYINGENPMLVKGYIDGTVKIAHLGAYVDSGRMTTPAEINGAFNAFRNSTCKAAAFYGFDDDTDLRKFPNQWNEIIAAGRTYWHERGIDL